MIDKKNILVEKKEHIHSLCNMLNSNHIFIFDKNGLCEINFNPILHKQGVAFMLLFNEDELSAESLTSLNTAKGKGMLKPIGSNIFAIIEGIHMDNVNVVPSGHILIQAGAFFDNKEFIGLILKEKLREQLNNIYSILRIYIKSNEFLNEG